MLRTALKSIAARKLRLLATSVAVMLGVAFMAGTFVLTDTIGRSFDQLFDDVYADTDTVVRGEAAFSGDLGGQRANIDADLVDDIAAVEGVEAAIPEVSGLVQIVGADGDVVGGGAGSSGQSWVEDDAGLDRFRLVDGRRPVGSEEVVIDQYTADTGDLAVGDTAKVLTPGGNRDMTVVGIVTYGDADSVAGSSMLLFDLETASELLGEVGKVTAIYVSGEDGIDAEALTARVADAVPDGVEAVSGQEAADDTKAQIRGALGFVNTFLLVFALIALFVGSFIIYNTFSILVAQRGRENALLRAIGASRNQVLSVVLIESVVVGLIASVLGLLGGIAVAASLKALLGAIGLELPGGGVAVEPRTIVVSLIAGLGVSIVSALVPARRASKVPPIAALRDVAVDESSRSRSRMVFGTLLTVLGGLALLSGLGGDGEPALVGLGSLLVFIAVVVLGPVLARPIISAIGAPLARFRGVTGGLARQNAARNPKRTASTASALMIGVTLVGAISIIASSAKGSIDAGIDRSFHGDFVIAASGFGTGVSPTLAEELRERPELDAVSGMKAATVEIDGETKTVLGGDGLSLAKVFDVTVVDGSLTDLGNDGVAIDDEIAEAKGLSLGDSVEMRFVNGPATLRVAAVYEHSDILSGYVVSDEGFAANEPNPVDTQVLVTAADGVELEQADAAIREVTAGYPQVSVQDRDEYKASQAGAIDTLLNMIYALLALAVFIALIGIANTLALSILERTRELGLLRAVGMTRSQVRSLVRWEAVLISVLGAVLGLGLALLIGSGLVQSLTDEGLDTLVIPVTRLVVIVVLAGLAGVAASLLPARRAAKLDVLKAITSD